MKTEEIEESKFVLREYTKTELALLYCPQMKVESATRKLNRWIRGNEPLMEALNRIGLHPKRWSYSAREVSLIVQYLGAPG